MKQLDNASKNLLQMAVCRDSVALAMSRGGGAETIWLFREHLVQARAIEKLFALFNARLKPAAILRHAGQMFANERRTLSGSATASRKKRWRRG
jgi:hypothetical protein